MYFEELELGRRLELAPVVLGEEELLAFSRRYDNIPLHTDPEYAKTTPFGRVIAPGVLTYLAGWTAYLQQDLFGEALIAGKGLQMEWHRPVFAGDVLTGQAEIVLLEPNSSRSGSVTLAIDLFDAQGQAVLTSRTEVVVKRRPPCGK